MRSNAKLNEVRAGKIHGKLCPWFISAFMVQWFINGSFMMRMRAVGNIFKFRKCLPSRYKTLFTFKKL